MVRWLALFLATIVVISFVTQKDSVDFGEDVG